MSRGENTSKGKQGFQRTVKHPLVPTGQDAHSHKFDSQYEASLIPDNRELLNDLYGVITERKIQESCISFYGDAVLDKVIALSEKYDNLPTEPTLLTAEEEQELRNAVSCGKNFGPDAETLFNEALALLKKDPHLTEVVRHAYFTSDANVRPGVKQLGNCTANILYMTVVAEKVALADSRWRSFVKLLHGYTEYVNNQPHKTSDEDCPISCSDGCKMPPKLEDVLTKFPNVPSPLFSSNGEFETPHELIEAMSIGYYLPNV